MRALEGRDLEELAVEVERHGADEGVVFHSADGDEVFVIDPVPRVLAAAEWARVEAGLAQRVRALNAFVADVYGERRIVAEGVVPARVIEGAEYLEPGMQGVEPPGGLWIGVAGLDLVRDDEGRFRVLEDNVRTPSGFAYAAAARRALVAAPRPAGGRPPAHARRPAVDAVATRCARPRPRPARRARSCSPTARTTPPTTSTSGPPQALGVPLLEPERPRPRRRRRDLPPHQRGPARHRRRRAAARADPRGQHRVVNAFGTGVADDKLTHAYVEDMIRFYEDEEPLLPSVETFDLGDPAVLERALDVFDELVIKPRGGYGGEGVAVLPHAEPWDVEAVRKAVRERPEEYVAQRMVMISCHPTVIDGRLAARHVDLRPFVFLGRRRPRPHAAGRPHARRVRRGRAGRQLVAERRREGHVGAAVSRPLIGVTTSEVRLAEHTDPLPEGDPPQREMALGMVYMRAIELAGGIPVVLPPLGHDTIAPLLDRLCGVCLSGGPDIDPEGYGEETRNPQLGADRAEPRRLRARARPARRRARDARARHLPRRAGAQRRARRHAAPARRRLHRRLDRAPPGRARPHHDALGADRSRARGSRA